MIRKIGVKEASRNDWRVTYDGRVLGDSRGYATKDQALSEAKSIVARTDDGDWRGSEWVNIANVLDV